MEKNEHTVRKPVRYVVEGEEERERRVTLSLLPTLPGHTGPILQAVIPGRPPVAYDLMYIHKDGILNILGEGFGEAGFELICFNGRQLYPELKKG
jgi:hypothetical protein